MKVITLSEVASRLRQRRQGRGYIGKFINECTIEDAIPLDRIKQAREEIKQNAYPIVHGVNNHDMGMTLDGIFQVLDKLIAESEVDNG